jgi:hypothetical protein
VHLNTMCAPYQDHKQLLTLFTPVTTSYLLIRNLGVWVWLANVDMSWSHRPRGLRRGSAAACLLELWVRIPPAAWMSLSCKYCVLSGKGLCNGLITRPGVLTTVVCLNKCDGEASIMKWPWPTSGYRAIQKCWHDCRMLQFPIDSV